MFKNIAIGANMYVRMFITWLFITLKDYKLFK